MNSTNTDYNSHGVALSEIEAGKFWPMQDRKWGRVQAKILRADQDKDEYDVMFADAYQSVERTVSGEAFRQRTDEVENPISDEAFNDLQEDDLINVWVKGHEDNVRVFVEDIDYDENEVLVKGECHCQTVWRWVPQALVWSPDA